MSDYKVIATNAVPQVTEVRLYDETIKHVKENHPEVPIELPSISVAVSNALTNPTHVEKSYGNSYVFVDGNSTNASGDALRVPVKTVANTSARVKTVYFAETSNAENVIWRRGNE